MLVGVMVLTTGISIQAEAMKHCPEGMECIASGTNGAVVARRRHLLLLAVSCQTLRTTSPQPAHRCVAPAAAAQCGCIVLKKRHVYTWQVGLVVVTVGVLNLVGSKLVFGHDKKSNVMMGLCASTRKQRTTANHGAAGLYTAPDFYSGTLIPTIAAARAGIS